tara:strand:+ start:58 stop:1068 length:1011 start_codon:yes stop_codon:yes gene_type:complete
MFTRVNNLFSNGLFNCNKLYIAEDVKGGIGEKLGNNNSRCETFSCLSATLEKYNYKIGSFVFNCTNVELKDGIFVRAEKVVINDTSFFYKKSVVEFTNAKYEDQRIIQADKLVIKCNGVTTIYINPKLCEEEENVIDGYNMRLEQCVYQYLGLEEHRGKKITFKPRLWNSLCFHELIFINRYEPLKSVLHSFFESHIKDVESVKVAILCEVFKTLVVSLEPNDKQELIAFLQQQTNNSFVAKNMLKFVNNGNKNFSIHKDDGTELLSQSYFNISINNHFERFLMGSVFANGIHLIFCFDNTSTELGKLDSDGKPYKQVTVQSSNNYVSTERVYMKN